MRKFSCFLVIIIFFTACNRSSGPERKETFDFPFQNYNLPVGKRVNDLVSRLTLEEKVKQMSYDAAAVERLGIPAYNWWNECLHGIARNGRATVFPQAIGLAATFNEELIFDITTAISDEARAKFRLAQEQGNYSQYAGLTFWSPNVNIFRDPRWGRGQETYGEDPYLTSRMGVAFVNGLQGDHPRYLKGAACAKHYVVHSGPERVRHEFNAIASPRDMAETYLPAFKALADNGVEGFMCAYNRTNGEACCGSPLLLTEILRNEWGFDGYITSDCWALQDFYQSHKVTATPQEAAALALHSGVNLNCGDVYDPYLAEAVRDGLATEEEVDVSLKQLLKTRFRLGLFDPPELNPYYDIPPAVINSKEHKELALMAARQAMVLLKNEHVLPLPADLNTLYLVGPNASTTEVLLGNYYGVSGDMNTFLEGIVAKAGDGVTVQYKHAFLLDRPNPNPIDWSTGEAHNSDAIVIIGGISPLLEGEEGESIASTFYGDRYDYDLPDNQVEYIKRISGKGEKPIILVLTGGSPVNVLEVEPYVDAIIYAWYPGEEGGSALGDILFGNVNPSGRLPVTFPVSLDQLPPYEDYGMQGRTYRYMQTSPAYPFGFGLSYTEFSYDAIQAADAGLTAEGSTEVVVTVSNTGNRHGDEVVQLYITPPEGLDHAPFYSLKGFKRIHLKSGESKKVRFTLEAPDLMLSNEVGEKVLYPGVYTITAGGASPLDRSRELGKEFIRTQIEAD